MLGVRDFPQVFLVDSSGNAERLIFKQNTQSLLELVAQIAHGKGRKAFNIFSQEQPFSHQINRLSKLKTRFKRLLLDDPRFGLLLLALNVVFLGFAWRLSGHVADFLYRVLFGKAADVPAELESSKRSE